MIDVGKFENGQDSNEKSNLATTPNGFSGVKRDDSMIRSLVEYKLFR